jgi:hypothetical protein
MGGEREGFAGEYSGKAKGLLLIGGSVDEKREVELRQVIGSFRMKLVVSIEADGGDAGESCPRFEPLHEQNAQTIILPPGVPIPAYQDFHS